MLSGGPSPLDGGQPSGQAGATAAQPKVGMGIGAMGGGTFASGSGGTASGAFSFGPKGNTSALGAISAPGTSGSSGSNGPNGSNGSKVSFNLGQSSAAAAPSARSAPVALGGMGSQDQGPGGGGDGDATSIEQQLIKLNSQSSSPVNALPMECPLRASRHKDTRHTTSTHVSCLTSHQPISTSGFSSTRPGAAPPVGR